MNSIIPSTLGFMNSGGIRPFMIQVDTTETGSASDTFILPCGNIGTYNAVINWGDGNTSIITTYDDADLSHTYSSGGVYTISITGNLPHVNFNNGGDKEKLIDITQWGDIKPESCNASYYGCSNLIGSFTDILDTSDITSFGNMFRTCTSFNGDISLWNTSSATSITFMFTSATSFNQDLNSWNVSNVINMRAVFNGASLFNGDISLWDVSNVADMDEIFRNASVFNQDLSDWNVSGVIIMSNMFDGASVFNSDLSSWSVSNVTDMTEMFRSCTDFNANISSWNVSNVTGMGEMFRLASVFNQDLSLWDISNVTNMNRMFENSSFSTTNYDSYLIRCDSLTVQSGVALGASGINFTTSVSGVAHTDLVNNDSWVITDAGGI